MKRSAKGLPVVALAAALAITSFDLRPAHAAPEARPQGVSAPAAAQDMEFSSRRRARYYNGNAAAAAAVLGMFGTIAGLAAASQYRRHYYYAPYGYYAPPAYYYAPPAYYAPPVYYRPGPTFYYHGW